MLCIYGDFIASPLFCRNAMPGDVGGGVCKYVYMYRYVCNKYLLRLLLSGPGKNVIQPAKLFLMEEALNDLPDHSRSEHLQINGVRGHVKSE